MQRRSRKRRKQRQRRARAEDPVAAAADPVAAAADPVAAAADPVAAGADPVAAGAEGGTAEAGATAAGSDDMARGYARGRARDEAARAALEPLDEGERPKAVTVGALAAGGLALAEVIRFVIADDPGETSEIVRSAIALGLLGAMAWGMWRVRYWAVLGMQTLLGITIVYASIAAMFAPALDAVILIAFIVLAGALFWFLVKSMARIQMPRRPGEGQVH